ncbi:hypothetical protein MKX03_030597 [Papaver bracteatum]|nr:hypothetical protein MKX03_030597 [Papaver bracteatum]
MKLKVVCWKAYNYVRYDLKQIAFPFIVLKQASRLYAASWVRDIGPDLRPNDYKKDDEFTDKGDGRGMETLRPALQRVYMTKASSYRDALKSFIQGYQEGVQKVMWGRMILNCNSWKTPKRSD